ncbi:Ribonuclease II [Forsythia ovata]|uniref:Ribonuclease II n=1 Tax=Forsythia ovata TaxID=205694 RepID=A0ABD1RHZ0_9LAMI
MQNGAMTSIKPQQITFIVPGVENFDHTEMLDFVHKAQSNLDLTLLEFSWIGLLEKNKLVRVEELAEDDIYFTILESKGTFSVYRPRPAVQWISIAKLTNFYGGSMPKRLLRRNLKSL